MVVVVMYNSGSASAGTIIPVKVGDTIIKLEISGSGGKTFVALHANERTAGQAVAGLGGKFIKLLNNGRNVSFKLGGKSYSFDPNRIFTETGRRKTLEPYSSAASAEVKRLADTITSQLSGLIVGLHNNSDGGRYSISSYATGGNLASESRKLNSLKGVDPDNFVLTTVSGYYQKAVQKGYNAVLLKKGPDDGSLSYYCLQKGRSYLNIEAQPNAGGLQRAMYQAILR